MNNFLNSWTYLFLAAVIYLILLVYGILKISSEAGKLFTKIKKIEFFNKSGNIFNKFIAVPLTTAFNGLVKQESKAAGFIRSIEKFAERLWPVFTEPLNIFSLIIRKIYNDKIQVTLTYSAAIIVAFYIILSIF